MQMKFFLSLIVKISFMNTNKNSLTDQIFIYMIFMGWDMIKEHLVKPLNTLTEWLVCAKLN